MRTKSAQFSPKTDPPLDVTPLPGSLHGEWVRCGKARCRCARGELHGPYFRRFWREDGRTRRRYVRLSDVDQARTAMAAWKAQHRSLRSLLREFCAMDRQVWQLLRLAGLEGGA